MDCSVLGLPFSFQAPLAAVDQSRPKNLGTSYYKEQLALMMFNNIAIKTDRYRLLNIIVL